MIGLQALYGRLDVSALLVYIYIYIYLPSNLFYNYLVPSTKLYGITIDIYSTVTTYNQW
jgi:hypothetical protein